MRVCPKCGHHDPWYWRGSAVVVGLEWCKFHDFKEDYPELASLLIETKEKFGTKNFVFDQHYCYHLTKSMSVERQSLTENPNPKNRWHIPTESVPTKNLSYFGYIPHHHGKKKRFKITKSQKKLLEA